VAGRDDLIVWEEIKSGSRDALEELYCHYSASLIRYGIHITSETDLIEDTLHDLFLYLWTNREKITIKLSVRLYLYRAFRNNLIRAVIKRGELSYGMSDDFFPGKAGGRGAEEENYGQKGDLPVSLNRDSYGRMVKSEEGREAADCEKYAESVEGGQAVESTGSLERPESLESSESMEREERCRRVADALPKLGIQQREIVCLRFFNDLSNKEIAQILNIREQTVKNVLGKSLRKLRSIINL
jgi:RNA polymerase sigma factor (sigma-70 family)